MSSLRSQIPMLTVRVRVSNEHVKQITSSASWNAD